MNGLLACGAVALALILAEGMVRIMLPMSAVAYELDLDGGSRLIPHQNARWASDDYDVTIHTDSAGCHDGKRTLEKPHDVYRVAVLGESFLEVLQVPIVPIVSIEQGFTQQLGRVLGQWVERKQVEVINLGISGSGPPQYFRILESKGLCYYPDLVVMAILPDNDFRDSSLHPSSSVTKPFSTITERGSGIGL